MIAGAVASVRTISSSGMTLAGAKKCSPMTSSGRRVAAAISVMSRVEVLVASSAPGFATSSSALKILRFRSRLSNTASITTSAPARSA